MKMKKHTGYGIAVCLLLLLPGLAPAVTTSWNSGAGDWLTAGNWDTGNLPTGSDDTRIRVAGADVTLNGTGNAIRLVLDTATASAGTAGLTIGASGNLTLGGSGQITLLGNTLGAGTGEITLDGGILTTTSSSQFYIGHGGKGKLTINSGTFTHVSGASTGFRIGNAAGSTGDMIVNGGTFASSTSHMFVGNGGTGNLTVNGGNVSVALTMIVGGNVGSFGNVAS